MPREADAIRVRHMVDAAHEAMRYASGQTRQDLDRNLMAVRAIIKCLEIVGEAASKVTPHTRSQLLAVPWTDIVAMRNRLIHTYFDINLDIVWTTIEVDLPGLIAPLERWLAAHESR